ncbi:MAG: asparaginase [Acidimicrobiales bacterium]
MTAAEGVSRRPKVGLLFTGGTISFRGRDRLDLAWYSESRQQIPVGVDEFLASVPEMATVADVQGYDVAMPASHAMVDADWLELLRRCHELLSGEGLDGLVIGHGTNTLEETAYFLHLTLKSDRPVVVVGSMRPASGLSNDGQLNALNGVRVAADPASAGRGVVVLLNDTIHSARDVTKGATYRTNAFEDRDLGPLGYAEADGQVTWYHRSERLHTLATEFSVAGLDALPRVDVVVSYVGTDGALVDAAVAAGAKGIVSAGTGSGRLGPREEAALRRAAEQGIVVCQASRVGSGKVGVGPGVLRNGFVAAGNLVPWKARVLLALALTVTGDVAAIQRMFDLY